jgi:hypothetical protein
MQTTSMLKPNLRATVCIVSNYHMLGSRKCNIIHTRLKHQCSSLRADLSIQMKIVLNDILVPYIVKNFSDYNCYQLNIHLACHLNIQELYCYEFYVIRSVFIYTNARMQLFII